MELLYDFICLILLLAIMDFKYRSLDVSCLDEKLSHLSSDSATLSALDELYLSSQDFELGRYKSPVSQKPLVWLKSGWL